MPRSTLDQLERRGVVPRAKKLGKVKFQTRAAYLKWVESLDPPTG